MDKRYRYDTGQIIDQVDGEILTERQVVNRLNKLTKENEQLKSSNMEYEDALARHEETIKKLRKHNTQTYLTIKEAYNNERTQIGQNVLKQLLEQIE